MTETKSTISPFVFARGAEIHADHIRAVIEQQNWSRRYRNATYLSFNAAPNPELSPSGTWGTSGNEIGIVGLRFSDSSSFEVRADVRIVTPPGVTSIRVSARCQMVATHTGTVRFRWFLPPGTTVDGDLTFANADNGTLKTTTLDISGSVSATDHNEARLQVLLSRTAGTGAQNAAVRNLFARANTSAIGSSVPAW